MSVAQYLDVNQCVSLRRHTEVLQIFRLLKVGLQSAVLGGRGWASVLVPA